MNVSQVLTCLSSHLLCFAESTKTEFVIQYGTQTCINSEVNVFAFASELWGHNPNKGVSGSRNILYSIKIRCSSLTQTVVMY